MIRRPLALLTICAVALGCSSAPPGDEDLAESAVDKTGRAGLSALQKSKAEMLTSIWENGTTVLQYSYAEDIHDGRGYTSGRAGFCTGTGDAVLVVRCFDARTHNGDAPYLALRAQRNWDLRARIVTDAKAKDLYPGQGYIDSGYPACTISSAAVVSGDASCTSPTP